MGELGKPGCYGAASVFAIDSKVCRACHVYEDCGNEARHTLEMIQARVNVTDILLRHKVALATAADSMAKSAEPPPAPVAQPAPVKVPIERTAKVVKVEFDVSKDSHELVMRIGNVKARAVAISLMKAGVLRELKSDIAKGVNPFTGMTNWQHLRLAVDRLINFKMIGRGDLKAALMVDLGWSDGTATSQVSQVMGILETFGIIDNDGNLLP